MEAAARRADRAAQKRHRELARLQEMENAASAVEEFEGIVDGLRSAHRQEFSSIDWTEIESALEPIIPANTYEKEAIAKQNLINFRPNILHKIFGTADKVRKKREIAIEVGKNEDKEENIKRLEEHEAQILEWKFNRKLSEKVLKKDTKAFANALRKLGKFNETELLVDKLVLSIEDDGSLSATVTVSNTEIVPSEKYSLLRSGRLSVKNMPKTEFYTIYQDYVASTVLAVANRILSTIPIEELVVNASCTMLNKTNGKIEDTTILSVFIPRISIEQIVLRRVDPSDALQNFLYNQRFKKTSGFEAVGEVSRPTG